MALHQLRPWQLADIPSLARNANNPRIARNLTDAFPHPYTEQHAKAFIEMAMSHTPTRIFAIEVEGEAAGGIGLHPQTDIHRLNAELGYWLAEPHWGKGIMTDAIREMVAYGFANLEVTRIFARPYGSNIGSQKALEKAGFLLEGRFEKTILKWGELEDEWVYAVRKGTNV